MANGNAETVLKAYVSFSKGDMDAVSELIDSRFEIEDRIMPEGAVEARGVDALVANAAQVREVFGNIRWTPQEVRELGDRLLLRIRVEGAAEHTGLLIDDDIGHLYTLENGKVIRLVIFRTWDEAKREAGVE